MTSILAGKKILIGITGSISAYKACELIRLLQNEGADVQAVLSKNGERFITRTTLQALTGKVAPSDMWVESSGFISHIGLRNNKDLILIAPATANIIAKAATGISDDLLSSTIIARNCPLMIAPAMNIDMWLSPATQENVDKLKGWGVIFSGPDSGYLACGDKGSGRFREPEEIVEDIIQFFTPKVLEGKKVLITAGPTFEPIDPVRGITNHSSGKQGFDIALQAFRAGADTTLIAGPVSLPTPAGVKRIDVTTAVQMKDAVLQQINENHPDIFIAVAAVCDWGIANPSKQKIKKEDGKTPTLQFVQNPDILATVAKLPNAPLCIGFAAETNDVVENGQVKLATKGAELIVANNANAAGKDVNDATFIEASGNTNLGEMTKQELARKIIDKAAELLRNRDKS